MDHSLFLRTAAFLPLLLFLLSLFAPGFAEEETVASEIPGESLTDALDFYLESLHRNFDRPDRVEGGTDAEKAERKIRRSDQLVNRGIALAEIAYRFSQHLDDSDLPVDASCFLDSDGKPIKKKEKDKIPGTWNLYKTVPPNKIDLWVEACFLQYRAFLLAVDASSLVVEAKELDPECRDFEKMDDWRQNEPAMLLTLNQYAADVGRIEDEAVRKAAAPLREEIKRAWCNRALRRIERMSKTDTSSTVPVDELRGLVEDYEKFLPEHISREHVVISERMIAFAQKMQAEDILDRLAQLYVAAAQRTDKPDIQDHLATLDGVIRRGRLLGKGLPIWGVQLDTSGPTLQGKPFDPASLDGKIVLLDFWATWCGPCVAEFPHLKKLYAKYHDKGFEIIGYNVDSDQEELYNYLRRRPLPWPVLVKSVRELDVPGRPPLSVYYGARKLPVVLLRDRDGKTVLIDARGEELDAMLEKLIEN